MCGIKFLISKRCSKEQFINAFKTGVMRGPDNSQYLSFPKPKFGMTESHIMHYGFHRLAINGLDSISDQPMQLTLPISDIYKYDDFSDGSDMDLDDDEPTQYIKYTLICNGEIYNYKNLIDEFNITYQTHSDCEIIIHMFHHLHFTKGYSIDSVLNLLDGVFAFTLVAHKPESNVASIIVARDRFGVRPLYEACDLINGEYCVSSCLNTITALEAEISGKFNVREFTPGTYRTITMPISDSKPSPYDLIIGDIQKYFNINSLASGNIATHHGETINQYQLRIHDIIHDSLVSAVKKRIYNTDVPIVSLLSGGLDSSLIASIATMLLREKYGSDYRLKTYSIGMEGSEDLKNARIVSEHINSIHHEIIVTEDEFLNAIPNVIYSIGSYDTTTVRASVGNYLVCKYIQEQHAHMGIDRPKVVLNGDGSDEVCGGYLYFHVAPNDTLFDMECRRLLNDISAFDVLRSDRSISMNGLEARTPFLDIGFVETYLSIPAFMRHPTYASGKPTEKYLLRSAFDRKNQYDTPYLPAQILWRTKEAFSDGVSGQSKSWYEIIQTGLNRIEKYKENASFIEEFHTKVTHNVPTTSEQKLYRYLFNLYFGNHYADIIPYFWMPRFVTATDSSARTLKFYKETVEDKVECDDEE